MEKAKYIQSFQKDYQFRLETTTLRGYNIAVKQFLDYINVPLTQITRQEIRAWLQHLMEIELKPGTINGKLAALKTFFKYCLEEKWIKVNPTNNVSFLKLIQPVPRYLEHEQLDMLRKLEGLTLKERAIIEVLYATGVRISELERMKKEHIHWSERSILIPKGKGKKGRIVLFNQECAHHLKAYVDSRSDDLPHLFLNQPKTGGVYAQWVQFQFQSYSERLGFKVAPHTLRHTFAAHLAQKGMPIEGLQLLMGHEKHDSTRLYARLYEQARKEMYDEWM